MTRRFLVLCFLLWLQEVSGDGFVFTLKEPLNQRICRQEAAHYKDPGWTIEDAQDRKIDVLIDIPLLMRRQVPGSYEVTYRAITRTNGEMQTIDTKTRQVTIYDINECETGTHDCSEHATCLFLETGGYKCECTAGFRGDGRKCADIDECVEQLAICDLHATCANTVGSYECICNAGFTMEDGICKDIDECALKMHTCSSFAQCRNYPGGFNCKCLQGYEGDGFHCAPVNRCETGQNDCHPYADCLVVGDSEILCQCKEGFKGDGIHDCSDVDECAEGNFFCPENSHCSNSLGSYDCKCNKGFTVSREGFCKDINECLDPDVCVENSICVNTIGSYSCECKEGFDKAEDGTCQDSSGSLNLDLVGDNPMKIPLYGIFSEPGFGLDYQNSEDVSMIVYIPNQINGECTECGTFDVVYEAIDRVTGKSESKNRTVIVQEIDICALDVNHPHHHQCHPDARCHVIPGMCSYRCECPIGYQGDGMGPTGCKDMIPPIISYSGPEIVIKDVCRVCGTDLQVPDLLEPVIYKAVDESPSGFKDLSDRIKLTTEEHESPDCLTHHYTVEDDSGNISKRSVVVCIRFEDMRIIILDLQSQFLWQKWLLFAFFTIFLCYIISDCLLFRQSKPRSQTLAGVYNEQIFQAPGNMKSNK